MQNEFFSILQTESTSFEVLFSCRCSVGENAESVYGRKSAANSRRKGWALVKSGDRCYHEKNQKHGFVCGVSVSMTEGRVYAAGAVSCIG